MMLIKVSFVVVGLVLPIVVWSQVNICVHNASGKTACPPQGGICLVNTSGAIACSPSFGGIVKTGDGQMLCGPGQCTITIEGEAFCSALVGGSATRNSLGEPVCAGGCVPASAEACTWP